MVASIDYNPIGDVISLRGFFIIFGAIYVLRGWGLRCRSVSERQAHLKGRILVAQGNKLWIEGVPGTDAFEPVKAKMKALTEDQASYKIAMSADYEGHTEASVSAVASLREADDAITSFVSVFLLEPKIIGSISA